MKDFKRDFISAVESGSKNTKDEKERIWRNIDAGIKLRETKKRQNKTLWMAASMIFAVLIVFTAFTPVGRAAVKKIIKILSAEKTVTTTVEGEAEESPQALYVDAEKEEEPVEVVEEADALSDAAEHQVVGYAMYVDEARYVVEKGEEGDRIYPRDYPEDYPPVEMQILQVEDVSVKEMTETIFEQLKGTYDNAYKPEAVSFTYVSGEKLVAFNGDLNGDKDTMPQWDDEIMAVYVLDNTKGGVFVVWAQYFVEAEEGHGARFEQMLDQFEIIVTES